MEHVTKFIPHRPPFLFVDEIIEISDGSIKTRKKIDPGESFFKGHYPGSPVMPGVLLCESIFQSGAILISKITSDKAIGGEESGVPVLTRIINAKFRKMVKPGDMIEIETSITETLSNVYFMKGRASVSGKTVVAVEYACCFAKVEE